MTTKAEISKDLSHYVINGYKIPESRSGRIYSIIGAYEFWVRNGVLFRRYVITDDNLFVREIKESIALASPQFSIVANDWLPPKQPEKSACEKLDEEYGISDDAIEPKTVERGLIPTSDECSMAMIIHKHGKGNDIEKMRMHRVVAGFMLQTPVPNVYLNVLHDRYNKFLSGDL